MVVAGQRKATGGEGVAKRLPTEQIEHDVLVACRRRCCLCNSFKNDRWSRKLQLERMPILARFAAQKLPVWFRPSFCLLA